MRYFVVFGALACCVLSALLGLTIGINMNPNSTTRYVLNWGSLGDWVAGFGAFFAVGVALWQSYVQRRDDVEDLAINQAQGNERWRISVVSKGKRPVRVLWIGFYSKKMDTVLPIKSFIFHGDSASLPQTLGYAENIDFLVQPDMFIDLAVNAVIAFDNLEDLQIQAKTTLGEFREPVSEEAKVAFLAAVKRKFQEAHTRGSS